MSAEKYSHICMAVQTFKHLQYPLDRMKQKLHVQSPWFGGTYVYTSGPGHMTKMAAMSIYGKKTLKISGTKRLVTLKLSIQHRGLRPNKVCTNDDPGLTQICFLMLLCGKMLQL